MVILTQEILPNQRATTQLLVIKEITQLLKLIKNRIIFLQSQKIIIVLVNMNNPSMIMNQFGVNMSHLHRLSKSLKKRRKFGILKNMEDI